MLGLLQSQRVHICTTIRELGPKIPYYRRNYGSRFPNSCIFGSCMQDSGSRVSVSYISLRTWPLAQVGSSFSTRPQARNETNTRSTQDCKLSTFNSLGYMNTYQHYLCKAKY